MPNISEALEILHRTRLPRSRGVRGGGSPPATNDFPPAEEFQAASRGSGGAEPGWVGGPGTIIQNYNYITTVFYNLKNLNNLNNIIFFYNLNKAGWPAGLYTECRIH